MYLFWNDQLFLSIGKKLKVLTLKATYTTKKLSELLLVIAWSLTHSKSHKWPISPLREFCPKTSYCCKSSYFPPCWNWRAWLEFQLSFNLYRFNVVLHVNWFYLFTQRNKHLFWFGWIAKLNKTNKWIKIIDTVVIRLIQF